MYNRDEKSKFLDIFISLYITIDNSSSFLINYSYNNGFGYNKSHEIDIGYSLLIDRGLTNIGMFAT